MSTRRQGADGRVAAMHAHTRLGLAVAATFAVAAAIASIVDRDADGWLPLHVFLVGSLTSAIATVTLMLAVTWSAGPAPPPWALGAMRWLLAGGAAAVAAGRRLDVTALLGAGALAVAGALVTVMILLVGIRHGGRTRRFVPAIDGYLLALAAVVVGIGIGLDMAVRGPTLPRREAHLALNVLAFVGVVVASTLPYFVATQTRMKMSTLANPARLRASTTVAWAAAMVAALGAYADQPAVTVIGMWVFGAAVLGVVALCPAPGRKQLAWAGPRLLQLVAGVAWWVSMTWWYAATAADGAGDRRAIVALVVGGYAQILASSIAYLVPVVRGGGHERLAAGFDRTRSWLGLVLGNVAGIAALVGADRVLRLAVAAWVLAVVRTVAPPLHRAPHRAHTSPI